MGNNPDRHQKTDGSENGANNLLFPFGIPSRASDLLNPLKEKAKEKGDIIRFPRVGYDHYAIYVGNGRIIHRAAPPNGPNLLEASLTGEGVVRVDLLEDVIGDGQEAQVFNLMDISWKPFSPDEIVKRAFSKVGEKGYNLLTNNCEHFVTWCRYGTAISLQSLLGMTAPSVYVALQAGKAVLHAPKSDYP